MSEERKPSRFRIPVGFESFKPDLGVIIAEARKAARMQQKTLAYRVGIARQTLSAIETQKAWPSPDTISEITLLLNLADDKIYVNGPNKKNVRFVDNSPQSDQRLCLGSQLRQARKQNRQTIRQLSKACGISTAQLSRIERGETSGGRAYEDHPDDIGLPQNCRRLRFRIPELQALCAVRIRHTSSFVM